MLLESEIVYCKVSMGLHFNYRHTNYIELPISNFDDLFESDVLVEDVLLDIWGKYVTSDNVHSAQWV